MFSVDDYLKEQNVDAGLIEDLRQFRAKYDVAEEVRDRVIEPTIPFYGREILEMAISALLQGENLLLSGAKATGKNVLCENLAYMFGRPSYNISFHVNTDSAALIGTDTFRNNEVVLRKGPVYQCADMGGFGVFDEINMAKNDAVSVLHATLDHRRIIDVPGYNKIRVHEAARFIGTMNYGYAGTRELNEALVSRFMVIDMPALTEDTLEFLLTKMFPDMTDNAKEQFTGLFMDMQTKAYNGEISTKPLDLRGLMSAIRTIRSGLAPSAAVRMGITNKSFDVFEREIIDDIVMTRVPSTWTRADIFQS
ncbi:MAG: MoxR family ATPase [Lachnospiraceae bacterium]|nr:MoxR family ATPase [Lachnospiraceae bacterium]MDY4970650.1 MoxR family ATPase [Lachnospiraceae bacterium]